MITKYVKELRLSPRVEEPKSEVNKTVRIWTTEFPVFLHMYVYCCYWYHYGCEYTKIAERRKLDEYHSEKEDWLYPAIFMITIMPWFFSAI